MGIVPLWSSPREWELKQSHKQPNLDKHQLETSPAYGALVSLESLRIWMFCFTKSLGPAMIFEGARCRLATSETDHNPKDYDVVEVPWAKVNKQLDWLDAVHMSRWLVIARISRDFSWQYFYGWTLLLAKRIRGWAWPSWAACTQCWASPVADRGFHTTLAEDIFGTKFWYFWSSFLHMPFHLIQGPWGMVKPISGSSPHRT